MDGNGGRGVREVEMAEETKKKMSEMEVRPFGGETVEGIKNAQIRSTGSMRSTGSGSFAKNPENHRKIRKNIRGQRKIPKNPKKNWLNLQL